MAVGEQFDVEDWYPDVNAKEDIYTTVTCLYKDESGVLLREYSKTSYRDLTSEDYEEVELIWVELK